MIRDTICREICLSDKFETSNKAKKTPPPRKNILLFSLKIRFRFKIFLFQDKIEFYRKEILLKILATNSFLNKTGIKT